MRERSTEKRDLYFFRSYTPLLHLLLRGINIDFLFYGNSELTILYYGVLCTWYSAVRPASIERVPGITSDPHVHVYVCNVRTVPPVGKEHVPPRLVRVAQAPLTLDGVGPAITDLGLGRRLWASGPTSAPGRRRACLKCASAFVYRPMGNRSCRNNAQVVA